MADEDGKEPTGDKEDEATTTTDTTEEAKTAAEPTAAEDKPSEEAAPDAAPSVTLLDRLGGAVALKGLVFSFYQRLLQDTALKPFFKGINLQKLRDHQYQFMTRVFSGVAPPGWDPATLIVQSHQMLFDKGLNEHHFDLVGGHWHDTMVDSKKIDGDTIQEIMAAILPLRPIFEERAKMLSGRKSKLLSKFKGSEANVKQALYNMYGEMASDPLLEPIIQGVGMAKIQNHQFKFLEVALTEIPLDYDFIDFLQSKHARLFRTQVVQAKHFDRMVQCLVAALKEVGMAQRDIDDARNTIRPLRSVFDVGPSGEEEKDNAQSEADSKKVTLGLLFGAAGAPAPEKEAKTGTQQPDKEAGKEGEERKDSNADKEVGKEEDEEKPSSRPSEAASEEADEIEQHAETWEGEEEECLADTLGIDLESDEEESDEEEEHSTISPDETKKADKKVKEEQATAAKPPTTNYGGLAGKLSGVLAQEANDQAENTAPDSLYQLGAKALFKPPRPKGQEEKEAVEEEEKQEAGYGGFASRVARLGKGLDFAQDDYFAAMEMRFETKVITTQKQEYDPKLSSASFMTKSVLGYQQRKMKKKKENDALNAELELLMAGGGIDD